jgi:hypothetical protein
MLNDTIPAAGRRTFDPSKPNPNAVTLNSHGPRPAKITKFSAVFFERNIGSDDAPKYEPCSKDDVGAIPRIRVYATFDKLRNTEGAPLVLSTKMRASTNERATFAGLLSILTGIDVKEIKSANLDLETLYGKPVLVTTRAIGASNVAALDKILPAPQDDDDDVVAAVAAVAAVPPASAANTPADESAA